MTDTTASLAALGIEPAAWHYERPVTAIIQKWEVAWREYADPHLRDGGYTETPLYSATDLAPLLTKARRVDALEAAAIALRDDLLLRAQIDIRDGTKIVNASNGIWQRFNAVLKENTDGDL